MKLAKLLAWLGLIAMTIALLNGFLNGDFFQDGKEILQNPWGIVSMVDLYVGFLLFSLWIFHRESRPGPAAAWIFFMMTLGFFTGSLYVLLALYGSKGDWAVFCHGASAPADRS